MGQFGAWGDLGSRPGSTLARKSLGASEPPFSSSAMEGPSTVSWFNKTFKTMFKASPLKASDERCSVMGGIVGVPEISINL